MQKPKHQHPIAWITFGFLTLILAVTAVACQNQAPRPTPEPTPTQKSESSPEPNPQRVTVEILRDAGTYDENPNNDYSPNVIEIPVGTTVTWVNNDNMLHTVTADDGNFDSGFTTLQKNGDTWSYTFTKKGESPYHCAPHPWMKGKVVVK